MSVVVKYKVTPRVKRWLQLPHEVSGKVTPDGVFRKHPHELLPSADYVTFHTHPARLGFAPPSKHDIDLLCRYARTTHVIVTHEGLFVVRVHCKVSDAQTKRLFRDVLRLQKTVPPGPEFTTRWLAAINRVAPRCLKIKWIRC